MKSRRCPPAAAERLVPAGRVTPPAPPLEYPLNCPDRTGPHLPTRWRPADARDHVSEVPG